MHDDFGCRTCGTAKKCKNGGHRPSRDECLEPTGHEVDAGAMDDQLKTVKRIGDTLGIKPASAEASGTQPTSGETIGAKTAR